MFRLLQLMFVANKSNYSSVSVDFAASPLVISSWFPPKRRGFFYSTRAFTQIGRASLRTGDGCFSCSRPADMIPSVTLNNGALMPVLALGTWKVRLNLSL